MKTFLGFMSGVLAGIMGGVLITSACALYSDPWHHMVDEIRGESAEE